MHRPTLCREGWYYLTVMGFILGGAIMRQINLLMVLFGMMAGPLLFNAWYVSVMLRPLSMRRRLPEAVAAGDPLVVELEVQHDARRKVGAWALVVQDHIQRVSDGPAEIPLTSGVLFTHVPPGEMRRASYRGLLTRRGQYRFGPLQISTRFPFGLVSRSSLGNGSDAEDLLVYPRLGELSHRWTRLREEAYQRNRSQDRRQGFIEGEFHNLRPWRSGDSRRWIHWRTTARQGELMVRQFEQQLQRDLAVLVDLWQPEKPEQEHLENVELAVSFAASICADMCRRGGSQLVLGLAARQRSVVYGPASLALLQDAMTKLALAEAEPENQLPQLLLQSVERIPTGTHVVLVSTRPLDLKDTARFEGLWNDPRGRLMVGRILTIDASSGELQRYFQPQ